MNYLRRNRSRILGAVGSQSNGEPVHVEESIEAYRTLADMEEMDENLLDQMLEASQKQWSMTPDGNLFWATTNVVKNIPSGLYKCIFNDNIGHGLQRLIVSTDDLIALPDTATSIVVNEIEAFWDMRQSFEKRGLLHKRGVLLHGEPGSGKTACLQQLVSDIIRRDGMAVYADDPHILTACLQMLRHVEPNRPVVVILEDFETLTDRQARENEWLSVLDGEAQINNVVFLASTNYIEKLDKRFTDRPSRFDVVIAVPMPGAKARALYLKTKEPSLSKEELDEWVKKSKGFSIAHLKEMIISVKCYGKTLDDTIERLRDMQRRKHHTEEELRFDPDEEGQGGFGFNQPGKDPVTDEDFDIDEWWLDED